MKVLGYIVPQSDAIVLGGAFELNDWNKQQLKVILKRFFVCVLNIYLLLNKFVIEKYKLDLDLIPRRTSCKQDLAQDLRYRNVNRSWKFRYKII